MTDEQRARELHRLSMSKADFEWIHVGRNDAGCYRCQLFIKAFTEVRAEQAQTDRTRLETLERERDAALKKAEQIR